jgi:hypothetical protein
MKTPNAQAVVITIQPDPDPLVLGKTTLATTPEPININKKVPKNSATK